ncbi:MAG: cysteine desulfurase family protein [Candidatus Paceibacterota bacterium]|jgi:cysteine desulfurase
MAGKKTKRIFWDTAAGCLTAPREASAKWGNPSSIHAEGLLAEKKVEEARAKIAEVLFAHPDEIIFTGSGTESDNLAILGLAEMTTKKHIITTAIEHKAVLEPCRHLQKKGYRVTYLSVDKNGQVNLKEFKESLTKDTFLISVMMANNETGSIQPIKEVAKIIRHWRKENNTHLPYIHTDACQAGRFLDLNVAKLGVDLLSFNGSKIYGPQGIGALYVRRGVMIAPIMFGGGQERGLRSGTHNVPGIVGLAEALAVCAKERDKESKSLEKIQKKLFTELKKISGVTINGGEENRLPNNINFSVEGLEGEQLVIELDANGFAVSSGSACSHDSGEGSYSIRAIGGSEDQANRAIRISLPREATIAQASQFIKALKEIIAKYKKLNF